MTAGAPSPDERGSIPRVSVVGSGSAAHPARAHPLGVALGLGGAHLVTGGGGGVMESVARAFTSVRPRNGVSIGILPSDPAGPGAPAGYPNPWVEVPIRTHLPARGSEGRTSASRNHLVVLTGEVVVALPGAAGTLTEVELALAYGRPVIAHLDGPAELPGLPDGVPVTLSLNEILRFLVERLGPRFGAVNPDS